MTTTTTTSHDLTPNTGAAPPLPLRVPTHAMSLLRGPIHDRPKPTPCTTRRTERHRDGGHVHDYRHVPSAAARLQPFFPLCSRPPGLVRLASYLANNSQSRKPHGWASQAQRRAQSPQPNQTLTQEQNPRLILDPPPPPTHLSWRVETPTAQQHTASVGCPFVMQLNLTPNTNRINATHRVYLNLSF